jgi:hypothetical protein
VVALDSSFRSGGGDINLRFTQTPKDLTIYSYGGTVSLFLPHDGYTFNLHPNGGNLNPLSSTPGSRNSITVYSGGGDINISYSN